MNSNQSPLSRRVTLARLRYEQEIQRYSFNPDETRDAHGQWTGGGHSRFEVDGNGNVVRGPVLKRGEVKGAANADAGKAPKAQQDHVTKVISDLKNHPDTPKVFGALARHIAGVIRKGVERKAQERARGVAQLPRMKAPPAVRLIGRHENGKPVQD